MTVASARKLGLTVLPFFLVAGASWAQTSSLEGTVIGEDGKPLQNALIKIERKDIKGNYQVKTKRKGDYFHAGLPLGTYKVTLVVDGKDRDVADNVRTTLGDPKRVDFNLQEIKRKQDALARSAETGQLTQEQAREMSPEQRAAYDKQMKERQAALAKNKALNDAFNQGKEAAAAKNWDAAIQAFTKATEMDSKQHVVWASLAEAHINSASSKTLAEQEPGITKGMEAWTKALELKPDDAAYHNNYALALARIKKFPEAQEELNKAAALDPASAGKYYYNLGAVLVNTGQVDPATEAFKKAIEADPNYAPAQFQYGVALMGKATTTAEGKIVPPPGTKEAFEKYLQLEPNGQFAEAAKGMLTTIEGTVQTEFRNPNAPAQKKTKKK
jgi:tetratricopeptide (TPR) repeat protein